MRTTHLLLLLVLGLSETSFADIIFELAPNNQQIPQGSTALFTLTLKSSQVAGDLVNSVDFNVVAGAGNGTGGTFVIPTSTVILGNGAIDFESTLGQAFGTNTQGTNILIPQSGVLLGNLYLNTSGVATGTYQMTLDSLAANQSGIGALVVSGTSVSYEVVSGIPEPGSLLLSAIGAASFVARRRRGPAKSLS